MFSLIGLDTSYLDPESGDPCDGRVRDLALASVALVIRTAVIFFSAPNGFWHLTNPFYNKDPAQFEQHEAQHVSHRIIKS